MLVDARLENITCSTEQIYVDVYVIPDTGFLEDLVIYMMLLPTSHTECVLEFGVGIKSFISSPYWKYAPVFLC